MQHEQWFILFKDPSSDEEFDPAAYVHEPAPKRRKTSNSRASGKERVQARSGRESRANFDPTAHG